MKKVYIVAAVRTPIGSFGGIFANIPAPVLGAAAIKGALEKSGIKPEQVDEVLMGNVLQANVGQAPARQASIFAGIPHTVPATTINKVCASGMKAVSLAAQSILSGDNHIVVAGGMENMSQVPHYFTARNSIKLGDGKLVDGLIKDGLTDVYNQKHMGVAAELCAKECNITREQQDEFAITSYQRSAAAWEKGLFTEEIVPVSVPQRKGEDLIVTKDEEYTQVSFDKIAGLKPVFDKEGSVTAANASTINDGAAVLILVSETKLKELNLKPLAEIVSYADAAHAPEWFTTAPSLAIPKALDKAGFKISDIHYWELNEAISVVGLVNMQKMGLNPENVNVNGGAVSLGHPLGCSGARIIVTLINVLKQNNSVYGAAGICNGGGGASAVVIKNI